MPFTAISALTLAACARVSDADLTAGMDLDGDGVRRARGGDRDGYVAHSGEGNDAHAPLNPDTPCSPDADGDGHCDTTETIAFCDQPPT